MEQQCSIDINIIMRRLVTPSGAISLQSAGEKWVEICFGTVPPAQVHVFFFILLPLLLFVGIKNVSLVDEFAPDKTDSAIGSRFIRLA